MLSVTSQRAASLIAKSVSSQLPESEEVFCEADARALDDAIRATYEEYMHPWQPRGERNNDTTHMTIDLWRTCVAKFGTFIDEAVRLVEENIADELAVHTIAKRLRSSSSKHQKKRDGKIAVYLPRADAYAEMGGEIEHRHFTVGTSPYCTFKLSPKHYACVSRLNAVFVSVCGNTKLLVLDVGSYRGVRTLKRTSTTTPQLQHSVPGARAALLFDANERVVLRLGDDCELVVNPLECAVGGTHCTTFRNHCGPCGHYVSCRACATEWAARAADTCPMCRQPAYVRNGVRHAAMVQSFVK